MSQADSDNLFEVIAATAKIFYLFPIFIIDLNCMTSFHVEGDFSISKDKAVETNW